MMAKSRSAFIHFFISSVIGLTFFLSGCYDVSYKNRDTGTVSGSWWNGLTSREIIEATPLVVKASATSVKKSSSKIPSSSDTVAKTFTIEWSLPAALGLNSMNDFEVSWSSNSTFDDGDDTAVTLSGSNFSIIDSGDSKNYKLTDTVNTQTVSGDYVIYFQVKMKDSNSEWYKSVVSFVLYPTGKNVRIRTSPVETDASALNSLYFIRDSANISQDSLPQNSLMLFGNESLDELYDSANNLVNPDQDTPFILAILTDMSGIISGNVKSVHYSNSSFCKIRAVTPAPDAEATLQYSFEDLPLDRLSSESADADGVRRFDYNDVVVYVDILPLDNEIGAPRVYEREKSLVLCWNPVKGATSYQVWYSTTNDTSTASQFGGHISGIGTSLITCTIDGLTNGTKYYMWLKAVYAGETGGFGPISSGTPVYMNITVSNLKAVTSPKQVTLTWTDPASMYLSYIMVNWTNGSTIHIAPGTQTCNVRVTAKGTPYTFTVTVYTPSGDSYATTVNTTGQVPIATADELNTIVRDNPDTWFVLTDDIDLSGYSLGEGWAPVSNFSGRLNGNGYKIINLTINRSDFEYQGLFGSVFGTGGIINLGLLNINITGSKYVGGLAGECRNGIIVSNCYATGIVKAYEIAGGLVGECSNSAEISSCYSAVNISGKWNIGGIVGQMTEAIVRNSYATGIVDGGYASGGLVGLCENNSQVNNCYAIGPVTDNLYCGGLVGIFSESSMLNSYYNKETSQKAGAGTGLTIVEMQQTSSYISWDFSTIWNINDSINNGYPYLRAIVP